MDNKRLFISILVDPILAKQILKEFEKLDLPWQKIKSVFPDQMHLTLKFIGDTPLEKLPQVVDSLNNIETDFRDIALKLARPTVFGNQKPRALVLKLEENKILTMLYQEIEYILQEEGIAHKEMKGFSPHVTLARIKKSTLPEEIEDFTNWQFNEKFFIASHFELKESELSADGPIHTVLQTYNFGS